MNNIRKIKLLLIIFTISTLALMGSSCNKSKKTLVDVGNEKITLGEFEKQYLKTIGNVDTARNKPIEDKRQFLNLYINFRLKVKDARERGLLNNPDIQKDVTEYKKNFAPNFLIDKEVVTTEVKKLYERRKDEVRASHILINLGEKATVEDSIKAYQTADSIIQKLKDGVDFGELALQYSQDRTVRMNKGDLYYFTAGMTVPEFEDAVYSLGKGEYTKKPVRTMFGLHIIKLTDRKPRIESVKLSHILIQDKRDSTGMIVDSVGTYQRAMDAYNKYKGGATWEAVVAEYSEDAGSKQNNGDLGFVERRRLAQPLDSAAFLMKSGEVIGPIRSPYGWHLLKKFEEKTVGSFEKEFENMKNEYKKTQKYKQDYNKFVETLKQKLSYKISDDGLNFLKGKFDALKTVSDYNLDSLFANDKEKVIATFDDGQVKVSDMINHLNVNRDFARIPLAEETLKSIISSTAENPLLNKRAEDMNIYEDDEFVANITEYENGLLVFRIDQDELWSKVKLSDAELQSYYEGNKNKYQKTDSAGVVSYKKFEEVKAEVSNEMQQVKYKEMEKAYIDGLRAKYPVTIHEDVLLEAFKD